MIFTQVRTSPPRAGVRKKPRPKEPRLDRTQCGRATDAGPRPGVGTTPWPTSHLRPRPRSGAHRCRGPRGRGPAQTRRAVPADREEVMPARPDQDSVVPATRRARRGHRPVTRGRPTFDSHAGRGVPMPSHPSARRCSRRRMYVRRRDGREGSGMSTQAGAFRCHRIRPRDAVPDGACMCAGATDVKAVGHKTLHLTRRTKTSLDDAKLLGRNPRPAEPTAGLS